MPHTGTALVPSAVALSTANPSLTQEGDLEDSCTTAPVGAVLLLDYCAPKGQKIPLRVHQTEFRDHCLHCTVLPSYALRRQRRSQYTIKSGVPVHLLSELLDGLEAFGYVPLAVPLPRACVVM